MRRLAGGLTSRRHRWATLMLLTVVVVLLPLSWLCMDAADWTQPVPVVAPKQTPLLQQLFQHSQRPCLPQFLVVGAQKGGTSSFHAWLKAGIHPRLHVPLAGKELDVLSVKLSVVEELMQLGVTDDKNSTATVEAPFLPASVRTVEGLVGWYTRQFVGRDGGSCVADHMYGEVAPNYAVDPEAPERARHLLPGVKLVWLLREPVARTKSAFNMKWQVARCGDNAWRSAACFRLDGYGATDYGASDDDSDGATAADWLDAFEQYVDGELRRLAECDLDRQTLAECYGMSQMSAVDRFLLLEDRFHIGRSLYADQVASWMRHFPPDRFLFLSSRQLESVPRETLGQFMRHVGVSDWDSGTVTAKSKKSPLDSRHHVRAYPQMPAALRPRLEAVERRLADYFAPFNRRLFRLLDRAGHRGASLQLQRDFAGVDRGSE